MVVSRLPLRLHPFPLDQARKEVDKTRRRLGHRPSAICPGDIANTILPRSSGPLQKRPLLGVNAKDGCDHERGHHPAELLHQLRRLAESIQHSVHDLLDIALGVRRHAGA